MNKKSQIHISTYIDSSVPLLWSIEEMFSKKPSKKVISSWTAASFWGVSPINDEQYFITTPKGYNPNNRKDNIHIKQRTKSKYEPEIIDFEFEDKQFKIYSPERTLIEIIKESNNNYTDIVIETIKNFFKNIKMDIQKIIELAKVFGVIEATKAFIGVHNQ